MITGAIKEPVKVGGFKSSMAKHLTNIPLDATPHKSSYRRPDEWGVYNEATFEELQHDVRKRAATRVTCVGQQEMKQRVAHEAENVNPEDHSAREHRVAFALGKLLHAVLQPGEQHELINSLECGLKIEPVSDAVLYYASEAIRALPDGQWDDVFSLLDQGGSFR
jgi:hypothetical protein